MQSKLAKNIMRPKELSLTPSMTLDQVSDHFTKYQLPGAPVVDADGNLVGYVSEYDCLQQLMQSTYYHTGASLVEDVMTTSTITASANLGLIDLASEVNRVKVNVMPLIDDNGEFVGMVTRGDILRAMVASLSEKHTAV